MLHAAKHAAPAQTKYTISDLSSLAFHRVSFSILKVILFVFDLGPGRESNPQLFATLRLSANEATYALTLPSVARSFWFGLAVLFEKLLNCVRYFRFKIVEVHVNVVDLDTVIVVDAKLDVFVANQIARVEVIDE